MTAAEVRIPHARWIVAAIALIGCSAILWLARGYTFYFDEWSFILSAPDWTAATYLEPHNVHPAMLPRLIYAAMLNTIGLRAYWPYMVLLLALHAASVILLFELVRRRGGDALGIACALILLFLGAGWENLLWAFQISFVGSVACGLAMLLALEGDAGPRRLPLATALLVAALMFSGIGLFFGVAAAVRLAATKGRRGELFWLLPVGIVFGAWFLAFGRNGVAANPPSTVDNLMVLPQYTLWGLGASAAAIIGEGGMFGPPLLILAAGAVAFAWWRWGADPLALGVAAALVTFYVVTGLSRAQFGYQQSASGRYVYEGAIFWMILLAGAARHLPWRGTWRPAFIAAVFLMCFASGALLFTFAVAKTAQMQREIADLQALADMRTDKCLNPNGAADPLVMPQVSPALFYRAIDRFGDPVAGMARIANSDYLQAKANLRLPGCQ
jgi:hypothetical protein